MATVAIRIINPRSRTDVGNRKFGSGQFKIDQCY